MKTSNPSNSRHSHPADKPAQAGSVQSPATLTADRACLSKARSQFAEFGLVEPLIWNELTGYVVGGHARLRVSRIWASRKFPYPFRVELDSAHEKALNVILNNHEAQGRFDTTKLANLLTELEDLRRVRAIGLRFDDSPAICASSPTTKQIKTNRDWESSPSRSRWTPRPLKKSKRPLMRSSAAHLDVAETHARRAGSNCARSRHRRTHGGKETHGNRKHQKRETGNYLGERHGPSFRPCGEQE